MKAITLTVLVSFLVLSGLAVAAQSSEQKHDPSMEHMMKEGKAGQQSEHIMRMMKMMDQCSAMMESAKELGGTKGSQKQ